MADAANLDGVAIGADEEEPAVANPQPKLLLFLGELSRRPHPIAQSDATRSEYAWRWA